MPPRRLLTLALAGTLGLMATATTAGEKPRRMADEHAITQSSGFLYAHPDLKHRTEGQKAFADGRYRAALESFRRAARYGDKLSQAMLAEMYWQGTGTAADPVKGYIWMDLAAERGFPAMLVKRERYWAALSEAERQQALAEGPAYYDEYGDAVAKPRLSKVIQRERRKMTGSRVGFLGAMDIYLVTPDGAQTIRAEDYYHEQFWEPELYFRWQDRQWQRPLQGTVSIGELMQAAPRQDDGE